MAILKNSRPFDLILDKNNVFWNLFKMWCLQFVDYGLRLSNSAGLTGFR